MLHELTALLHAGGGRAPLWEYLYRVGLHLLAFATVAVVTYWSTRELSSLERAIVTQADERTRPSRVTGSREY